MKILTLKRIAMTEWGTFGVLLTNGYPFAVTIENPWINNRQDISCIPENTYFCERVNSPKFGNTFEIKDVPNRTHILLHFGNRDDDTAGCVLIAEEYGKINGEPAVLTSRNVAGKGFNEFINILKDDNSFILNIINNF